MSGTTPGMSRRISSAVFDWRSSTSEELIDATGLDCTRLG
nr:hypothetical protein [Tanacetum cinerariifolium]